MSKRLSLQVLLVEGDRPARILMQRDLPEEDKVAVAIKGGDDLADLLARRGYDVLQLEHQPTGEDSEPVRTVRGSGPDTEVVVVSRPPVVEDPLPELEVDDAYDFLTQPLPPDELRRLTRRGAGGEGEEAARPSRRTAVGGAIVGDSPQLATLLHRIERIAPANASVLIHGETGTGKSLVAQAIHEASHRKDKPFIVVTCSAFQDQLLESELFGHDKGAFTGAIATKQGLFEIADGGTLFLDEVGEMTPAMQAKLLQVLDTGEMRRVGGTRLRKVDVRIIAASNKDLSTEVKAGKFREDLLFRLDVVTLEVPPLRQRRGDVSLLVEHFLERFRPPEGPPKTMSASAMALLSAYHWPGNVRELANTVEGLVLLAPGELIGVDDLPPAIRPSGEVQASSGDTPLPMSEIERLHIARTLRYTEGKKAPAARLLGIDVKTLNSKIRNYDIEL